MHPLLLLYIIHTFLAFVKRFMSIMNNLPDIADTPALPHP